MTTGKVRIQFLGSGDAFGSGGRRQACVLVEARETTVLVDCGASSLAALKGEGVDPNTIEAVLVSHLHGDHFGGIPFLILDGQFAHRSLPLRIVGPAGIETRVTAAMELFFPGAATADRTFDVTFQKLSEGVPTSIGPLSVTPYEVTHACGATPYALRVEVDGRVIAFSGDTGWTEHLIAAASGADLFVCEAYYYEKRLRYHLDYQTLMRHRPTLKCKRLILTHMSSDMLSRVGELDVEDGARWPGTHPLSCPGAAAGPSRTRRQTFLQGKRVTDWLATGKDARWRSRVSTRKCFKTFPPRAPTMGAAIIRLIPRSNTPSCCDTTPKSSISCPPHIADGTNMVSRVCPPSITASPAAPS